MPAADVVFRVIQRHDYVPCRRGPRQEVETLKDESQLRRPHQCPLVGRDMAHVLTVEPIVTGSRPVEAAEDVHQGRFAGSRGADQGHHFAAGNGERDAPENRDVEFAQVIGLGNAFKPDQFHRALPSIGASLQEPDNLKESKRSRPPASAHPRVGPPTAAGAHRPRDALVEGGAGDGGKSARRVLASFHHSGKRSPRQHERRMKSGRTWRVGT